MPKLCKGLNKAKAKQKALEVQFMERVTAIKGQAIILMPSIIIVSVLKLPSNINNTVLCPSCARADPLHASYSTFCSVLPA